MLLPENKAFDFLRNMSRYFWLLLVIFTLTAGVLFLDHFRTYTSQVTILVVHKNEKTAASADQVVNNIVELPKTLAFYNRLLKQFPEVRDPWMGMNDATRLALWNERVSVARIDKSGLIQLQINANSASDASLLAEKSAFNLFQIIGQYYDIRTEIDIRTVEPSITRVEITHPFGWFLASVSLGFIVSVIVSSGILMLSQMRGRAGTEGFSLSKKEPVKSVLMPVTFNAAPPEKTPARESVTYAKPSTNLPFLDEGMSLEDHLFGFQDTLPADHTENAQTDIAVVSQPTVSELPVKADTQEPVIHSEPTAEELKRRLNQLLKGGM